ncbi:MAG: hypothetical protein ACTHMJ_24055 [Thermomicrobiales bacterium]
MTLDEAIAILRDTPDAGVSDALALVPFLAETDRLRVLVPLRRCKGVRCPVTSPHVYLDRGCVCQKSAIALRLLERARDISAIELVRPQQWTRRCAACRLPFTTGKDNEKYCTTCNDTAKRRRGRRTAA